MVVVVMVVVMLIRGLLEGGVVVGVTKAHIVDVPRTRIMLHFARLSSIYINVSYIYIPLSSIYKSIYLYYTHISILNVHLVRFFPTQIKSLSSHPYYLTAAASASSEIVFIQNSKGRQNLDEWMDKAGKILQTRVLYEVQERSQYAHFLCF